MENSPGSVTCGKVAKVDESSVTATCRNARLEINELATTRKDLSDRVRALREKFKKTEDDYWSQYHLRLNETNTGTATKLWVASFATKEGVVAKQTKQKLDVFRGQIRDLEVQLQKADDEFWGKWQDVITKLATVPTLPRSCQAAPDISLPSTTANLPGRKPREDVAPHQPRSTTMLPTYSTGAVSPLAPPAFFPDGPPLQTPAADEANVRSPHSPVVESEPTWIVPEPSQQVSETTSEYTASIPGSPESNGNIVSSEAQHQIVEDPASPSQGIPQINDSTGSNQDYNTGSPGDYSVLSTEGYHETTAEDPPFFGVTQPVVGGIYKAYYKHDDQEGWWMCTVLPTLPAYEKDAWMHQVGISFPSASLDLWHDAPDCYNTTIQTKRKNGRSTKNHYVITGWKPGYEDGGPLVAQRAFPVLFFEDRRDVKGWFSVPMPPRNFNFRPAAWDWVEAKNLRPVEDHVDPVYGEAAAHGFSSRMAAITGPPTDTSKNILLDESKSPKLPKLPKRPEHPEHQEYRPAKRPRIRVIGRDRPSTQAQSFSTGGQEEKEVTDAVSLSGDTIAASSSAVQSDDELSKPR